ncbi:MAG: LysM peptidoglycan-binding domain-containing protein, partial [Magnetococcales bacterium]|nr:LysM peptidoglycan-binding domain-containing protein [Magnetococcales bacterium]
MKTRFPLGCLLLAGLTATGCALTNPFQSQPGRDAPPVRIASGPPLAWNLPPSEPIRPSNGGVYEVKAGDTLWAIALVHQVDVESLARWNNIRDPDLLFLGQTLRLSPPPIVETPT